MQPEHVQVLPSTELRSLLKFLIKLSFEQSLRLNMNDVEGLNFNTNITTTDKTPTYFMNVKHTQIYIHTKKKLHNGHEDSNQLVDQPQRYGRADQKDRAAYS